MYDLDAEINRRMASPEYQAALEALWRAEVKQRESVEIHPILIVDETGTHLPWILMGGK